MTLWDDLLAAYEREQARRDPRVGPSDAQVLSTGCLRQLAYRSQGFAPSDPEEPKRLRAAILGEALHRMVADARRAAGWDMVERDVQVPGFPRPGRLDAWHRGRLDDVKTVSDRVFRTVLELGKAREGDGQQAELYGLAVPGTEILSVTYLHRETGEVFEDSWTFDPVAAERTRVRMLEAIEAAARPPGDLGRAARTPHDRPCDACPFRSLCWGVKLEQWEPEPAPVAPASVQAAARRYHAAAAAKRAAEDAMEEARYELAAASGMTWTDDEGIERMVKWSSGREPGDGGQLDTARARALLEYYGEQVPTRGTAPRLSFPAVR